MRYWGYRPKLKSVKEGMKLQSEKISRKWWSDRWLSILESFGWENRIYRGLTYAREGQVFDLEIKPGKVTAKVQGTKSKPYRVSIKLEKFSDRVWNKVIPVMGSGTSYIAKLIIGEMPLNIEGAFYSAGAKLFPEDSKDLLTECSCPDPANPCKHIAAVYFVLAEEFDRNPFMIFLLRGRSKKEIMDELGRRRRLKSAGKPAGKEKGLTLRLKDGIKTEPPGKCIDRFWSPGEGFSSFKVSIVSPRVNMALLKRLGPPVFCDREKYFWSLMKRIYRAAVEEAKAAALSDIEEKNVQ